jgi:hypothetical protein
VTLIDGKVQEAQFTSRAAAEQAALEWFGEVDDASRLIKVYWFVETVPISSFWEDIWDWDRWKSQAEFEADPTYINHHTASRRGYESRKGNGHCEPYSGRFGKGFIWVSPRWDTSSYVYVTYYIKKI